MVKRRVPTDSDTQGRMKVPTVWILDRERERERERQGSEKLSSSRAEDDDL